jgi:hypothetical protein
MRLLSPSRYLQCRSPCARRTCFWRCRPSDGFSFTQSKSCLWSAEEGSFGFESKRRFDRDLEKEWVLVSTELGPAFWTRGLVTPKDHIGAVRSTMSDATGGPNAAPASESSPRKLATNGQTPWLWLFYPLEIIRKTETICESSFRTVAKPKSQSFSCERPIDICSLLTEEQFPFYAFESSDLLCQSPTSKGSWKPWIHNSRGHQGSRETQLRQATLNFRSRVGSMWENDWVTSRKTMLGKRIEIECSGRPRGTQHSPNEDFRTRCGNTIHYNEDHCSGGGYENGWIVYGWSDPSLRAPALSKFGLHGVSVNMNYNCPDERFAC